MIDPKTPRDAVAYVPDGEPRTEFKSGELKSDHPTSFARVAECNNDVDAPQPRQPYKAVPVFELGTRGENGEWVPLVPEREPYDFKVDPCPPPGWHRVLSRSRITCHECVAAAWQEAHYPDAAERAKQEAKRLNEDRT